jgi:hypothetical protein
MNGKRTRNCIKWLPFQKFHVFLALILYIYKKNWSQKHFLKVEIRDEQKKFWKIKKINRINQ